MCYFHSVYGNDILCCNKVIEVYCVAFSRLLVSMQPPYIADIFVILGTL